MAIVGVGLFGVSLFLTCDLQSSRGFTPVRTGLAFLPMMGSLMVVAQLPISVLLPKIGPKILVPLGLLTSAAGLALLTVLDLDSGYAAGVLPGLVLIGSGIGLSLPPAMSLSIHGVRVEDAGVASAAVNTISRSAAPSASPCSTASPRAPRPPTSPASHPPRPPSPRPSCTATPPPTGGRPASSSPAP
jgi:hypothetical protein